MKFNSKILKKTTPFKTLSKVQNLNKAMSMPEIKEKKSQKEDKFIEQNKSIKKKRKINKKKQMMSLTDLSNDTSFAVLARRCLKKPSNISSLTYSKISEYFLRNICSSHFTKYVVYLENEGKSDFAWILKQFFIRFKDSDDLEDSEKLRKFFNYIKVGHMIKGFK